MFCMLSDTLIILAVPMSAMRSVMRARWNVVSTIDDIRLLAAWLFSPLVFRYGSINAISC